MTIKSTKKTPSKKANGSEDSEELELEPSPAFQAKLNGDAPEVLNPDINPVVVKDKPSAKYEVMFDHPETLIPLLRECWDAVRQGDAEFDNCAPDFRETLLAHALGVLKTPAVLEGDSHMARFENQVAIRKNKGQIEVLSYINQAR